jgi:hypothetical protein
MSTRDDLYVEVRKKAMSQIIDSAMSVDRCIDCAMRIGSSDDTRLDHFRISLSRKGICIKNIPKDFAKEVEESFMVDVLLPDEADHIRKIEKIDAINYARKFGV